MPGGRNRYRTATSAGGLQQPVTRGGETADEAELAENGRDYLERIRNAAKRMQDLINDLLMFSRISAKEQAYAKINLTKIAKSVLSDLEVRIEENEAEVKLGELPTIEADPVHMRQLLQNLIGNALKFTRPEVKPVVEVTAEPASAADRGPDAGTSGACASCFPASGRSQTCATGTAAGAIDGITERHCAAGGAGSGT